VSDGEVYGAMSRSREQWEGVWGVGLGTAVMARYMGRWAGRGSDGELCKTMSNGKECGALGWARE